MLLEWAGMELGRQTWSVMSTGPAEALAGRCQDDPLLWQWVDAGAIHRDGFPWKWTGWQRRGSLMVCWAFEMPEIGAEWAARCHGWS